MAVGAPPGFIGREHELETLRQAVVVAGEGRPVVAIVGGEPGIGKTTLAHALAYAAEDGGFRVLWGRCWESGGAPAYWPWLQVLRPLVRDGSDVVAEAARPAARYLGSLLPSEVDGEPAHPLDSDEARFSLFDALAGLIRAASEDRPLLLILEDLHVADASSLVLLRFLARSLEGRVMVLGTYRDVEVRLDSHIAEALGEVAREGLHLTLEGLGPEEVSRFIAAAVRAVPPGEAVAEVHRMTAGNPLFVQEFVRLFESDPSLLDEGRRRLPVALPDGLRQAIRRRLDPLSRPEAELLRAASVIGTSFSLAVLCGASSRSMDETLALLDVPLRAGIVRPDGPGRYTFSHALLRETVYDDMTTVERVRHHQRVAEVLEAMYVGVPDRLSEIAHHLFEAAAAGDTAKSVDYAEAAGRHAMDSLAFDEAADLYDRALQVLALGPLDERRCCELLISRGEALNAAGRRDEAKEVFTEAVESARRVGPPERFARAVLGYGGGPAGLIGDLQADHALVALCDEALGRLGEKDTALRVQILARLGVDLFFGQDAERSDRLGREAVQAAERLGDRDVLAYALAGRLASAHIADATERLATAEHLLALTGETGAVDAAMLARGYRIVALYELGRVGAADGAVDQYETLATLRKRPLYRWQALVFRAMQALYQGRFKDAKRLADDAVVLGHGVRKASAELFWGAQVGTLSLFFGSDEETEALAGQLQTFAGRLRAIQAAPLAGAAWILSVLAERQPERSLQLGEQARAVYDRFAITGFRSVARDRNFVSTLALLSDACAQLRDVEGARLLSDLLEPYADQLVMTARGAVCHGAVSRHLARLAHVQQRYEDAEEMFRKAADLHARTGGRPWLAVTRSEWARMLLDRGDPADAGRARELMGQAVAAMEELGMDGHAGPARRLLEGASGAGRPATETVSSGRFRREGDVWTITFDGETVRIRHAKGLSYLAMLLSRPGEEVHSLALVASVHGHGPATAAAREDELSVGRGDAGDVLDQEARTAYRARIHDLRAEIDEAEAWGDPARADKAREELDQLTQALAGAVGLGGRARKAGSDTERARISVTKSIKAALTNIGEHAPGVAAHLRATVRTGTFCTYNPDPRSPVRWET